MREVYGVRPVELNVLKEDTFFDGPRALEGDVPYTVELLREGERLRNEDGTVLQLRYKRGSTGGLHGLSRKPTRGGLMPRRMAEPFEFLVGYGDAGSGTTNEVLNWEGLSSRGVKDYHKFELDDNAQIFQMNMFSYAGELFFTAQQKVEDGFKVVVYRYSEEDDLFTMVKRFDKYVDTQFIGSQEGSPDAVEIDGELYIFFRVYDREKDESWLVSYKSSGDLADWDPVTEHKVTGEFTGKYNTFRLRVAYGYGTLMIGWFAEGRFDAGPEIGPAYVVHLPVYRTFLSFDDGLTIQENGSQFVGLSESGNLGDDESLHSFFIPEHPQDLDFGEYKNWSVNFDLYFDQMMGSFVILKGGDPNPDVTAFEREKPKNYLIGIKTEDGDFTSWEPCLQLLFDSSVTNITDQRYAFGDPTTNDGLCFIEDVKVITDGGVNTLLVSMWEYTLGGTDHLNNGVALGEFVFIEKSQVYPGSYTEVFAHGTKSHPRYSFLCSPMSVEYGGLVSVGSRMGLTGAVTQKWDGLTGCLWREQVVAAAKPDQFEWHSFFAVAGPWGNMGEDQPYQLSYTPLLGISPWNFHMDTDGVGAGTVTYDDGTALTTCSAPNSGDKAWVSTLKLPNTSEPPDWRSARDPRLDFKVKFEFKISENVPSNEWTEILAVSLPNPDDGTEGFGYEMRVRLWGTGEVELVSFTGASVGNFPGIVLDDTKTWELCIKMGAAYEEHLAAQLAYREAGTKEWFFANRVLRVPSRWGLGVDPYVRFGVVDYSSWWNQTVDLGKIQIGTASRLYAQVYRQYKKNWGSSIEPMMKRNALVNGETEYFVAREAAVTKNEVEISDGSLLRFSGPTGDKDYGVDFKYARTPTRNSVVNIIDQLSHSVFDFTYLVDQQGETEIIFENVQRQDFKVASLINMFGVTSFKLRIGEYDELTSTWTLDTELEYEVPYTVLDVAGISGSTIILADSESFSDSELRGRCIMLWDGAQYTDQIVVTDNFDVLIRCSGTVPFLGGGEMRLMDDSSTVTVANGVSNMSHVSLTLRTPATLQYSALGGFYLGRKVDFSPYLDEFSEEKTSQNDIITGNTGYDVMRDTFGETVFDQASLSFKNLGWADDGAEKVKRFFNWMGVNKKQFPLVVEHHDGVVETRVATVTDGVGMTPSSYTEDVQVQLALANFSTTFESKIELDAPVISRIGLTTAQPDDSTQVGGLAYSYDPAGGSLTYQWDFGDGNSDTGQGFGHTWTQPGEYLLKVTATSDVSGLSTTRSTRIYVSETA